MPNSVIVLGKQLFFKCSSIEKVEMPSLIGSDLYNVKSNIFEECNNLREIIINNTWKRNHIRTFDRNYVYNDSYSTFEECLNSYWFKITIRE